MVELIQKPFKVDAVAEIIEDLEVSRSVKELTNMVRKVKDINNPTPTEMREILKAAARAHKRKSFNDYSN